MTAPDWRATQDFRMPPDGAWDVVAYGPLGTPVGFVARDADERTAKHIAASWRTREMLYQLLSELIAVLSPLDNDPADRLEDVPVIKQARALLASLEETE